MLAARSSARLGNPNHVSELARVMALARTSNRILGCPAMIPADCRYSSSPSCRRTFSTTPAVHLRDFFPPKETEHIRRTPPAWKHKGYTMDEMLAVEPGHREPRTWGDWAAWKLVRLARYCMDRATGLRPDQQVDSKKPTTAVVANKPLTEAQWVRLCRPVAVNQPHLAWFSY